MAVVTVSQAVAVCDDCGLWMTDTYEDEDDAGWMLCRTCAPHCLCGADVTVDGQCLHGCDLLEGDHE